MNRKQGFTLIEVLIAVFILVLVMGAAIMVENQGLKSGVVNQSRLYATGLAQEGLEMTKWQRDENIRNKVKDLSGKLDPLNNMDPGKYCWDDVAKKLVNIPENCSLDNNDPCICKITGPDGKTYLREIDIE